MSWFMNGWLRFGQRKAAKTVAEDSDNEEDSYPKEKQVVPKELVPFTGGAAAATAATGSWIICHDHEGRPYWWNDITGQWSYQMYSTHGYVPQLMPPISYPQQRYSYPALASPQYSAQQSWLASPSGAPPGTAVGMGWGAQAGGFGFGADYEEEEEEEETWDKFYDGLGRPVWINSCTGARINVDPSSSSALA